VLLPPSDRCSAAPGSRSSARNTTAGVKTAMSFALNDVTERPDGQPRCGAADFRSAGEPSATSTVLTISCHRALRGSSSGASHPHHEAPRLGFLCISFVRSWHRRADTQISSWSL
jgi:hypothetical protein